MFAIRISQLHRHHCAFQAYRGAGIKYDTITRCTSSISVDQKAWIEQFYIGETW